MHKFIKILGVFLMVTIMLTSCNTTTTAFQEEVKEVTIVHTASVPASSSIRESVEKQTIAPDIVISESVATENTITATDEEIELIALVTMAEAEGECEEGKRLVIDTILNRVDSEHFPDTISEVIYQPNQFSPMWNGRVERCWVKEDICQLVREELDSRTNYDVIFFTAGNYSNYGVPLFRVEHHYFSSYD